MWKLPYLLMNCSLVRGPSPRHENVGLSWSGFEASSGCVIKDKENVTQLRGFRHGPVRDGFKGGRSASKQDITPKAFSPLNFTFKASLLCKWRFKVLRSDAFHEMWNKAMYVRLNSLRATIILPIPGQDIKRRWWQQWLRFNGRYVETNSK